MIQCDNCAKRRVCAYIKKYKEFKGKIKEIEKEYTFNPDNQKYPIFSVLVKCNEWREDIIIRGALDDNKNKR